MKTMSTTTATTATTTTTLHRYIVEGEKDIKKSHDYSILRQVFDMARDGGDDWVVDFISSSTQVL